MSSNNKSDFVLLSKLIHKLEDNDYYRVFAKTLAMTATPTCSIPPDNELVKEMFHFFIRENELQINYNGSAVSADFIESEAHRRASEKTNPIGDLELAKELERTLIWEKEVYIKVQDLKKLYANKCIVFPKSLLTDSDVSKSSSRK
jgi:hypothetical protein